MSFSPKSPQELEESSAYLTELKVLLQKSDLEFINFLKTKGTTTETELRECGAIIVQSLRSFC